MRVDAGTSTALFARASEDFHEQTAMEAGLSFLQTYGRPYQITFDRDPTLGRKRVGPRFSLTAAAALVVLRDSTRCLSAASPREECLRNGMIAKDTFCLSRSARLRLSWSRQPVRSNLSQEKHIGHPIEQDDWNDQEGANAAETTSMEHLPSVPDLSRGMEALGSGLPSLTHPGQPSPEAGG